MAINTSDFKNGMAIDLGSEGLFQINEFQHVKPGKGGAFVRTKLRRHEDGSVIDKTFRAGEKFRPVHTETRKMQYLYENLETRHPASVKLVSLLHKPARRDSR